MITQVLNRQFVLDQIEAVQAELANSTDNGRGLTMLYENAAVDLAAAAADLLEARNREAGQSSGQRG